MSKFTRKKRYHLLKWSNLIGISLLVGFFASVLAISLKHLTEHFESLLFERAQHNSLLMVVFPIVGLALIYVLRKNVFNNNQNKGITEIFQSLDSPKKLPLYKIPSHFVNGFLTVVFGGSTGIEVSTVVASATVGSVAHKKQHFFIKYRKEFMCAGIAAGITALFNSPLAGMLFSLEVISRRITKVSMTSMMAAVLAAIGILWITGESRQFPVVLHGWNLYALPYFAVLGIFAAINSVYLTRCVIFCKTLAAKFDKPMLKIAIGGMLISFAIVMFPQLYGDGYHALSEIISGNMPEFSVKIALLFVAILALKPLLVAVTLASGGDGGVFAPSLITGAFAGVLIALAANFFFAAGLLPINFMLVGMAAVLSASIHAPFTSVFLVCGLTGNYTLLVPLLFVALISKFTAKKICPYNVYTYGQPATSAR